MEYILVQRLGRLPWLLTDTLLLGDVFRHFFRYVCLDAYTLDPMYYYNAPGLAWDAMLKMTGISLEPVTDIDMHWLLESGLRGVI